jgi:hypothetical protein
MTALLALIPTKDKVYGILLIILILGGLWYHHKLINEGILEQKAADDKVSATLVAKTAVQTAELKAKATMAEQAYDKEQTDNANYRGSHPEQPVRLCVDSHNRSPVVPKASGQVAGNANPSASAVGVQPVPSGDSSGGQGTAGPDIEPMLSALSSAADQVSSTLREYQSR